jgi:transposase-like protein
MAPRYTLAEFLQAYPNDDVCLDWLLDFMYPSGVFCAKCNKVTKHHRCKPRKSYSCHYCGHHVHPTAGTIYHKSSTPLRYWFYAIFVMSNTRCGVSAKQLERELGVTYKTAWRMFKQIRSMLGDSDVHDLSPLGGVVEVDETRMGAKPRQYKDYPSKISKKTLVAGAVERGGRIRTRIIVADNGINMVGFVRDVVEPRSTVYTDEHGGYARLRQHGYLHKTVTHWAHEYVRGDVSTNTIEGFWGNFKTGFRGAYKHCGSEYLPSYLDEFAFRYNHRKSAVPMFQLFMAQHRQESWWTPYAERLQTPRV